MVLRPLEKVAFFFFYISPMQISLRVLEMNPKWTKILYNATNVKSRMETPILLEQIKAGKLKVTNAAMFPLLNEGNNEEEE